MNDEVPFKLKAPTPTGKGLNAGLVDDPHISREFYLGHKTKILAVGFLDFGSQLVSFDSRGYLFFWQYNLDSFTGETAFEPSEKLRVELEYIAYPQKSSQKKASSEYQINLNFIKSKQVCKYKDSKSKRTNYVVPRNELPEVFTTAILDYYSVNAQGDIVDHREAEVEGQKNQAQIITAEFSKDNKYLIVHLLKDHQFGISG